MYTYYYSTPFIYTFFTSIWYTFKAYTDSDSDVDPETRRSVSAYCVFIGVSIFFFFGRQKKPNNVSLSSNDFEYREQCVSWLRVHLAD